MSLELKSSLYEMDYQLWLDQTVKQLRSHDFNNIDLDNLIEEIESLGKSDKRAISSYLRKLCEHLLKLNYWTSEREVCFRGWDIEITNFRLQIQAILEDSPSLRNYLDENFAREYGNGRKLFLKASGLNLAGASHFCSPHPKSLSQSGRGTSIRLPFSLFGRRGW
ncbi:MAG: DUF29 domain-containing protein, partial [Leptolyngbyaceae cyanobacterium RM1_406_9]|nr:DUF29 domain-containing protein [Leptolyngbyaceae cyanobacterium RM1_406_9]